MLTSASIFAQNSSAVRYIENKGQWDASILYRGNIGNASFYINKKGFSVLIHHPQDYLQIMDGHHSHTDSTAGTSLRKENYRLRSHLYRVSFAGGNESTEIVADKILTSYNNYFYGSDPSKWAGNCRLYLGITVKNIYDGVNARYYSEAGQLKYDLIISPGTDISKIKLRYEGVDKLFTREKQLIIPTSVGESKELYPYSYQYINNARQTVDCRYIVKDNEVSFDVRNYSKSEVLVIDPTVVFATLSGSPADNWGMSATYGPDGSFFGGSIALGDNFIVTPGAYDQSFNGGTGSPVTDMAIMKFSPDGSNLIWATYIGGSGNEQPHSLITDNQGNLVIAGRTNSPASGAGSYPVTNTVGSLGGSDIVITKLNAAGSAIIGSMRIGGQSTDGANIEEVRQNARSLKQNYGDDARSEVILDRAGNILVASNAQSADLNFTNGFQNSLSRQQDGVVIKLNANATALIWGTFIGGSGDDAAYVLAIDPITQKIYAAGGTNSNNFPGVNNAGVLQSANAGGVADGFVAALIDNGTSVSLDRSTYTGTGGIDQVYGIQFDEKGFPYVMGQTTGNWPVINAAFSNPNSRQFIAKLRPDLSAFVYSTCFGTSGATAPNISPVAFLVDKCENVYVSGWGGGAALKENFQSAGTFALPVTSDAFQRTTDGSDFYFFILQKNAASQLFGSFFGETSSGGSFGEHVDGGTSRFDRQGIIYQGICANCGGVPKARWPATLGSWSTVNGSGSGCNFGALKIAMNFAGVQVALKAVGAKQLTFCLPATVEFADTLRLSKQYIWDFGDGTKRDTTNQNILQHVFNQPGFFDITVIGIDSNTCNISDTARLRIRVTTDSVQMGFNYSRRQPCTSLTFDFTNTSVPPPGKPFNSKSFVWVWNDGTPADTSINAAHTFPGPGTYDVQLILIDTNYCNSFDTVRAVNFSVASTIKADFDVANACLDQDIGITDKSVGASTYLWDFGDGTTSADSKPVHAYNAVGNYTITLTITNPNSCNLQDVISKTVTVNPVPTAAFSYTPNPSRENTPTTFINNSSADAIRYLWDFGDGKTSDEKNPVHQFNATAIFNVCLKVFNAFGCVDSVCQPVEAKIITGVVVPNAFTPNNDGKNDILFVKAFGVAKMAFRIYNRLGQKVFESASLEFGWDGRYKGALQPTDAYAYTLDIEFFDGKKERLKGDITLIR